MILETLKLDITEKAFRQLANFHGFFFGTDQILVRQRYSYKLRGSSLENYTVNGVAVKKDILYT